MTKTKSEPDETAPFLQAIAADPADESSRLVFADWLEERGDWRAEFLRIDCALATRDEATDHADRGDCVAIKVGIPRSAGDLFMMELGELETDETEDCIAVDDE